MESKESISKEIQTSKKALLSPIERIVCSGGGAKGIVYPGSYQAMRDTGLLKTVTEFAGASAGAITSAFMAIGMSVPKIRETLLTTNLQDLMGDSIGHFFGKNKAGVCFITKDGKPLEHFIRDNIVATVKAFIGTVEELGSLSANWPEFADLLFKLNDKTVRLTFADLALLHRLFPDTFKRLTIPAVRFPTGEVQIFSVDKTPDVEIALACRASASIPVILEPVMIDVNGKLERFVDGGLYDNLPTDYFDVDAEGAFIKNTKPSQTLVFAFGEGVDDKKNPVFQALYGHRFDEVMSEALLGRVLESTIAYAKSIRHWHYSEHEEETFILEHALRTVLLQLVKGNKITDSESEAIMIAVLKSIDALLFGSQYDSRVVHSASEDERVQRFGQLVKDKLKPVLSNKDLLSRFKRTVLIEVLGDLKLSYSNPEQDEAGCHKLRKEYPLRTVELRVGDLDTLAFNDATKYARIMDTMGYLDTINYLTNHDLHNPSFFDAEKFFEEIVLYFEHIYHAVLDGADKTKSDLLDAISTLRNDLIALGKASNVIHRQLFQLIKEKAEFQLDSIETFALSRAVEFYNGHLKADALFKEVYELGFKKSTVLSTSQITGERFFRLRPLHEALKDKSMFHLFQKKPTQIETTRSSKIYSALQHLEDFRAAIKEDMLEKDAS